MKLAKEVRIISCIQMIVCAVRLFFHVASLGSSIKCVITHNLGNLLSRIFVAYELT